MNYFNGSGYMFYNNDTVDFTGRGRHLEELYAERAERIIHHHAARHNNSQPMFLYLASQAPHFPHAHKPFTRAQVMDELVNLDRLVGRVVAALKTDGLYQNTLIVFTTDNGGDPNFGGNNLPLRGQKETLWEGGLRGPAFVHAPALLPARGVVSYQLFHITDWLPTLLRAAGLSRAAVKQHGWDGVDQWDALHAPPQDPSATAGPRTEIVLNMGMDKYNRLVAALRQGPYKLMVDMARTASDWIAPLPIEGSQDYAYKLFNVVTDPSERVNLAANLSDITKMMATKVGYEGEGMEGWSRAQTTAVTTHALRQFLENHYYR
jgi:arylsulfatase A-like enzyme